MLVPTRLLDCVVVHVLVVVDDPLFPGPWPRVDACATEEVAAGRKQGLVSAELVPFLEVLQRELHVCGSNQQRRCVKGFEGRVKLQFDAVH